MNILPPKAATKFMELRHQSDNLQALISSSLARAANLRRACQNNPTGPEVASWDLEIRTLQAQSISLQEKAGNATQLLAQLNCWMQTLRPSMKLADRPALKLPMFDGDNHISSVGAIRRTIAELSTELHAVNHAGPTKEEQQEAARKYVDSLIGKCRPSVKAAHGKFEFSLSPEPSFANKLNIPAALAWLDKDRFLQNILDMIDAAPKARIVMSGKNKEDRIAEIRAEMLKNERFEEWLISDAAKDGLDIPRRPMANPLAVLSVTIATAENASAAA